MAAADHSLSRRALLGAAVALPLAGAASDADGGRWTPDQVRGDGKWLSLVKAYRAAEDEVRAFERATSERPFEEQEAIEPAYARLGDAMYAALRRLLRSPAPDIAALATKIELIVEHEVGTLAGGQPCIAALRRDARRLADEQGPRRA